MNSTHDVAGLCSGTVASDVLIIVPPFGSLGRPSLAAHLLQGCARRVGIQVSVLYANMLWAARIGVDSYNAICESSFQLFLGERVFARSAYGLSPLGVSGPQLRRFAVELQAERNVEHSSSGLATLRLEQLRDVEALAPPWASDVAAYITGGNFKIVGATTTFAQTAASISLLRCIKAARPETITVIGGGNCEGAMALGMVSLDPAGEIFDIVFSGEGDATFPLLVKDLLAGVRPLSRIVQGQPCQTLDDIPIPDYTEYFEQRQQCLPDFAQAPEGTVLPYETSRGCWWGQKHQCTFCGLNGEALTFRQKSATKALSEMRELALTFRSSGVALVDNIMPRAYVSTLLPELARDPLPVPLFYEQKANLTINDVRALKAAGVLAIQPGIEALDDALLQLMRKGVKARQNIALLRYARAARLDVYWNLLWGFPRDTVGSYEATLKLLPWLEHLQPPLGSHHITIDRFSPYFERPAQYGITALRPLDGYREVLPPHAHIEECAYHFVGDYDSESRTNPTLLSNLAIAVERWQGAWDVDDATRPELSITRFGRQFRLRDTRTATSGGRSPVLDRATAAAVLRARSYTRGSDPRIETAINLGIGVMLDGWYIPLATADLDLLAELQSERATPGEIVPV